MKSIRFIRMMYIFTNIIIATLVLQSATTTQSAPNYQQTVWGEL